jgi:hypothetical protein
MLYIMTHIMCGGRIPAVIAEQDEATCVQCAAYVVRKLFLATYHTREMRLCARTRTRSKRSWSWKRETTKLQPHIRTVFLHRFTRASTRLLHQFFLLKKVRQHNKLRTMRHLKSEPCFFAAHTFGQHISMCWSQNTKIKFCLFHQILF